MSSKTLDLGCGSTPRNPFNADELYGVDIVDGLGPNIRKADLVVKGLEDQEKTVKKEFLELKGTQERIVPLPSLRLK